MRQLKCYVSDRLLTLWFDYGQWPEVHEGLIDGIKAIKIDEWLQVSCFKEKFTIFLKVLLFDKIIFNYVIKYRKRC